MGGPLDRSAAASEHHARGHRSAPAVLAWLHQGVLLLDAEPRVQGAVHVLSPEVGQNPNRSTLLVRYPVVAGPSSGHFTGVPPSLLHHESRFSGLGGL